MRNEVGHPARAVLVDMAGILRVYSINASGFQIRTQIHPPTEHGQRRQRYDEHNDSVQQVEIDDSNRAVEIANVSHYIYSVIFFFTEPKK